MAENPLARLPAALPVLSRANALRRQVVGRLRAVDVIQWRGVPYRPEAPPDIRQQLHIWELNDLAPRDGWPAVLLLHGGGWREGSHQDFAALGPQLAHRGVLAIGLNYRLAPAHRWPAMLEDALAALDFCLGLQVDPTRIAAWGHSAGGHIALSLAAARPDALRCAVALGAPTELRQLPEPGLEEIFSEAELDSASPLRAAARLPPTLLVHGELDRVVPIAQARALAAAAEQVELLEVGEGDHGLRWPPLQAWSARRRALDWMMEQLDPSRRGSKWRIRRAPKKKATP